MREIYESVSKHGHLGLPLGCVIDVPDDRARRAGDTVSCIAYGGGGTFSGAGLKRVATNLVAFHAYAEDSDRIEIRALDVDAALRYMRHRFCGPFALYVVPPAVRLGSFD